MAVGRRPLTGGSWQVEGGMWPNCLGAVSKAGIRCPHQLVVKGGNPDIAGAGAVLSTFYVLTMTILPHMVPYKSNNFIFALNLNFGNMFYKSLGLAPKLLDNTAPELFKSFGLSQLEEP